MSKKIKKDVLKKKPWNMNSPKINVLAYADAPMCATGFGTVSRNIFEGLHRTGRYNIDVLSINYWGDPHSFPYRCWPTGTNQERDPYGKKKVCGMIPQMEYDILFFLQDTFILDFLPELIPHLKNQGKKFRSIVYFPVDGTPKEQWIKNVSVVDYPVVYSEFGKREAQKAYEDCPELDVISHGVNTDEYKPLPEEEVKDFRTRYFGPHADKFIFCFPQGHDVITNCGAKDISEINTDDLVLTHNNKFKNVIRVFERDYDGDLITISDGNGGCTISATINHPVFSIKRNDVLCKYNKTTTGKDNYVCRPKKDMVKYSRPCSSCSYYDDYVLSINKMNAYKINELKAGDFLIHPVDMTTSTNKTIKMENINKHKNTKLLPDKLNITSEVMEMFGLWLGDGSYSKNSKGFTGIVFSQLSSRRDNIEKFKLGVKEGFGLDCAEYKYIKTTTLKGKAYEREVSTVVCNSINLANVFYRLFGEYSYGKFISPEFNNISPELQLYLCVGYIESDGCVRQNNNSNSYRFDIVGESLSLLKSIQRMFLRNKVITSIFTTENNESILYRLTCQGNGVSKITELLGYEISNVKDVRNRFFIHDYLITEIKSISREHYSGKVFNMEVSDDNSYTVNGVSVHNCNLNRNQQRKDIPRTIQAFVEFRKHVKDSILYLHMAQQDQGWDLTEICKAYGLDTTKDVIFPENFGPNQGYPRQVVNMLYNCSDCVISTTLGEGWGLSWIEAMATKTPVIMPGNTALVECITDERGILTKSGADPSHFTILPHDNEIIRPLVDVEDMVEKMLWVYNNYDEAMVKVENAYEWVTNDLNWQGKIADRWVSVFDKMYEDLIKEPIKSELETEEGKKEIESEEF